MYKLFYSPAACSLAVHVALREVNAPFELHETSIKAGQTRSPEFMRINPRGQVPVLFDGEINMAIREGGAILVHLFDKHHSSLLPQVGIERARALQWLMWGNATLHPAYSRCFWINRNVADEGEKQALLKTSLNGVQMLWDEVEEHLATSSYLAGDHCTIGDILMTVISHWNSWFPADITAHCGPNVQRVVRNVTARPTFQAALAAEKVTWSLAA